MSLSDRLAAAAEARERAEQAGTTVEQLQGLGFSTIDLFTLADPPTPAPHTVLIKGSDLISPGSPDPAADPNSICPTCNRTGHLGVVDLPGRTSDYSCAICGTMWRVSLAEAPIH